MNIIEAQKLIELEASMPIFQAKRTEILVEKSTYDLVKIYHFLASQGISLTLALYYSLHKCIY